MPIGTIIALYFMLWWIALLIVLPFGSQKPDDAADKVAGCEPSAPKRFAARQKLISASILAAFMLALLLWGLSSQWVQYYWK